MASIISISNTAVILHTSTGERIIERTFVCRDVKIGDQTYIIIGAAAIKLLSDDYIYYPAICREDGNLYHLEFVRSNARRWRLEEPDSVRLIEEY